MKGMRGSVCVIGFARERESVRVMERVWASDSGGSFFDARFLSDAAGSVTQVCERGFVCERERECVCERKRERRRRVCVSARERVRQGGKL